MFMQVYGIDLSMEKFDVNFIDVNGKETHKVVKKKLGFISNFSESVPEESVLCAEHIEAYGDDLLVYLCNQLNLQIALVPGYTIKHSMGIIKGKSDPGDCNLPIFRTALNYKILETCFFIDTLLWTVSRFIHKPHFCI